MQPTPPDRRRGSTRSRVGAAGDLVIRRAVRAAAIALASGASLLGAQPRPLQDSTLVISVLEVGQGDAIRIVTPERKQILIDAGPGGRAIQRHLSATPSDTLDLVIASHNHDDHIGGMPLVFERYVVRAYLDNGVAHTTMSYRNTLRAVESEGAVYLQATARTIIVGSVILRILPPMRRGLVQNDNSVGVLVEFGRFRALFTGDSEQRQLAQWLRDQRIPRVQVLKAAHHGARNGFLPTLAEVARPGAVVISVAARNGYGHPAASVVRSWERAGARVYRTDRDSTVVIRARLDGRYEVSPTARGTLTARSEVPGGD